MENKSFLDVEKKYELEIDKIVMAVRKRKAKKILLQFPDGLKLYSTMIASEVEKKGGCECFIWLGDCFGACDVPVGVDVDLIVQFGHSGGKFKKKD